MVLEIGTNARGEIAALAALAAPTVGDRDHRRRRAHRVPRLARRACARRRPASCARCRPTGVAVLNADDPRVAGMARDSRARVVTYGRAAHRPRAGGRRRRSRTSEGLRFTLERPAASGRPVTLALAGRHNVTNALAAAAAGVALGLPLAEIAARSGRRAAGGRTLRVAPGRRGHDPRRHLQRQPGVGAGRARHGGAHRRHGRRVVVVLGDMLELGAHQRRGAPRGGPAGGGAARATSSIGLGRATQVRGRGGARRRAWPRRAT